MSFDLKILDLNKIDTLVIKSVEKKLSAYEKDRLISFRSEDRRLEWLAVRYILYNWFQINENLDYAPSGKPVLRCCKVSIAHSSNLAAVAISRKSIGLDIERINRNFRKIAPKYISNYSVEKLSQQELALIWTAKEAIYKLWSQGDLSFLKETLVDLPSKINTYGQLRGKIIKVNKKEIPVKLSYFLYNQHIITIAQYA